MLALMSHHDVLPESAHGAVRAEPRPRSATPSAITSQSFDSAAVSTYLAREDLFLEGDEAATVIEVLEGVICGYRLLADGQRHVVSFFYPGDLLGYCCQASHAFSAQALSTVKVRRIPRASLDRLVEARPDFARKLLKLAADELTATRNHLLCLASKSAEAKMASFLLALSRRNADAGEDATRILLPMTRIDIGDYLGLTIETVSRTLSKFKRAGLIALPRTSLVQLRNLAELEAIAQH
ncbi:MAG: helix-turn-helix domain-containing protein [Pseudomonadota bacterium]